MPRSLRVSLVAFVRTWIAPVVGLCPHWDAMIQLSAGRLRLRCPACNRVSPGWELTPKPLVFRPASWNCATETRPARIDLEVKGLPYTCAPKPSDETKDSSSTAPEPRLRIVRAARKYRQGETPREVAS